MFFAYKYFKSSTLDFENKITACMEPTEHWKRLILSPLTAGQCCRFSRNTAYVTPKISYFYYQKINLQDQSIQK